MVVEENQITIHPADAAFQTVLGVMEAGESTHVPGTWRAQDVEEHIRRALVHLHLRSIGNTDEPHLAHALTRLGMATALEKENNNGASSIY